jgi:alkylation response protein AidB-like acyl-CoA dehydrogenase
VPAGSAGLAIAELDSAGRPGPNGEPMSIWYHGSSGAMTFENCRVPAADVLIAGSAQVLAAATGRGNPLQQALNIGIGRAAFEAAIDYAKLRVQGGKPIIEHHSIATLLAEIAVKLQTARSLVWQAAWASDHPAAYADRSLDDLPLQTMARIYTAEAMHQVALDAAECFGAMGVMRDMPMQRYVRDAQIFLYSGSGSSAARLRVAEAIAGFRRAQ